MFFENGSNFSKKYYKNQINLKITFQNSFKLCKISAFNCFFSRFNDSHESSTTTLIDTPSFGLVWPKIIIL